jgi:hypothetical protein
VQIPELLASWCCDPDIDKDLRTVGFSALAALFDSLCDDGILCPVTNKQSALTRTLQQKIEQSDLILNLPSLLMMAADDLTDAAAASGSSSGSGGGSIGGQELQLANHLLNVYFRMQFVWPAGTLTSEVAAAAAVPAVELALAVGRYLSRLVQQQQQQQQGSHLQPPLQGLMPMDMSLFVLQQAMITRFTGR